MVAIVGASASVAGRIEYGILVKGGSVVLVMLFEMR